MYCIDNTEAHLKGTKVDQVLKNDHAYVIYEIQRCHETIRNITQICHSGTCVTKDPPCALEVEIDQWIKTKKVMFRMINSRVSFTDWVESSK